MLKKLFFITPLLFFVATNVRGQGSTDTDLTPFQASGMLRITTNGIAPVPAFSLDKPAVSVFLSLRNRRFSFDPEMAFSIDGVPWFLNSNFRFNFIEKSKFKLQTGLMWGISFSYPILSLNGSLQEIAKAERLFLLELIPEYRISEKVALGLTTYIGHNFDPGPVNRFNYVSVGGRITKIRVNKNISGSLFPQLYYLNIDGMSDGLFVSGVLEMRHENLPFILSAQINQPITTTISPDPAFKWNVSLSYLF